MDTKDKDRDLASLFANDADCQVPPEAEARMRRSLTTLRERMESSPRAARGRFSLPAFPAWGRVLAYAVPLIGFAAVGLVFYLTASGGSSSRAFAAVVEQIRKARTMTYDMTIHTEGVMAMTMQMAFKEPGLIRMSTQIGGHGVIDMTRKKGISVLTPQKQYIDIDLAKAPQNQMQIDLIEEMRSLPERADQVLALREMGGRTARGYRVTEHGMDKTLWVDAKTGDLIRMEGEFVNAPGAHVVLTNFRFDAELDDSLFSLEPPAGFTLMKIETDASASAERDLVEFLKYWTAHHADGFFPTKLEPAAMSREMLELTTSGKFRNDETKEMSRDEMMKYTMEMSQKLTRGLMFVMQMRPENDWHYVGEGVKFGDETTPVFWYKPDGSATYRVIYGDLSIRDLPPQDLPSRSSRAPSSDAPKTAAATPSTGPLDLSLPGEKDLIGLLRFWAEIHVDGVFPASVNPIEVQKTMPELEKSGKIKKSDTKGMTLEQRKQRAREGAMNGAMKASRGYQFVMMLTPANNWRYTGKDVKLGDAATPVFWYKPTGSQTYRVIYGDLSVRDLAPEDVPIAPQAGNPK
jgi:outer membrane lipoprotein-sorting protein